MQIDRFIRKFLMHLSILPCISGVLICTTNFLSVHSHKLLKFRRNAATVDFIKKTDFVSFFSRRALSIVFRFRRKLAWSSGKILLDSANQSRREATTLSNNFPIQDV